MKKYLIFPLLIFVFMISGCNWFQSSVIDDEEKQLPETTQSFTGEKTTIDMENSFISFVGSKGDVISHEGEFETFQITILLDENDKTNLEKAKIEAEIDIASMKTDNDKLTTHLLSADFFEVEIYPKATFTSTSIKNKGENMYTVNADFTLKSITQSISFDAEITNEYANLTYDLNRNDYGVGEPGNIDEIVPIRAKLILK